MDKDLKEYWLDDLRSDEFVQGRNSLLNENKYCCIGVLGETMGLDVTKKGRFEINGQDVREERICEAAGITGNGRARLIRFNDDGASFEEIADWIEVNL